MPPKKNPKRLMLIRVLSIVVLLAVTIIAGSIVFSRQEDSSALAAAEEEPGETLQTAEGPGNEVSAVSLREEGGTDATNAVPEGGDAEPEETAPAGETQATDDPASEEAGEDEAPAAEDPTEENEPEEPAEPEEGEEPEAPEDTERAEETAEDVPPADEPASEEPAETEPTVEPVPADEPAQPTEPENTTSPEQAAGTGEPEQSNEPEPQQPTEPEQPDVTEPAQPEPDPKAAILAEREALLPAHTFTGVFQDAAGAAVSYGWGQDVPETTPTDDSWFSDAVFVGNSLFDGLWLYGNIKGSTFLSAKSISVNNFYSEAPINKGGVYLTIPEALSLKQYHKVYVMLGVNELILDPATYYERYAAVIDTIRELQPGAEIYIQSITPVTRQTSENNVYVNQTNILAFNEQLKLLAANKQVYYINIHDALMDEEGFLPDDQAFDGIHLLRPYYEKWCDYLRCHTIMEVNQ